MSISKAADERENSGEKTVTVTVNTKPVEMNTKVATGLQIKDAAIAQGVKIGRNFTLTMEMPGDKSHVVRDDEEVKLHNKSEFTAVTPDDNS